MKAVRIAEYGGVEVLDVREVERPQPGPDQVLVAVRAAGINPSEEAMRRPCMRASPPIERRVHVAASGLDT
jgi:NADPH:quinone reductase-like Zn-dependent oxidoreductase